MIDYYVIYAPLYNSYMSSNGNLSTKPPRLFIDRGAAESYLQYGVYYYEDPFMDAVYVPGNKLKIRKVRLKGTI